MTFREALIRARNESKSLPASTRAKLTKAVEANPTKHKRLWKAAENVAIHRYEKQTGKQFTEWGDGTILKWLTDNLPALLKLLMTILAMFA